MVCAEESKFYLIKFIALSLISIHNKQQPDHGRNRLGSFTEGSGIEH